VVERGELDQAAHAPFDLENLIRRLMVAPPGRHERLSRIQQFVRQLTG